LATQIGSNLSGVLYILDEPSIGLHQRDNDRLIASLKKMRDLGNTLIVVEHDEDTMREADWLIDVGPGAGVFGGEIVAAGTPAQVAKNKKSITGQYLSGKREIPVPLERRVGNGRFIEITGAAENNLQNITARFPLGKFIAVTGVSGSGKSTLATLIARFADPDSGSIRLGGVDLRQLTEETLYSHVSFVLQDAQLLRATVRDNIALGRPGASIDEVREAARMARIDDFVMSLPEGYDTVIGTDTSLSGGQEQRIAIARALLVDAPVLLLDEATAFADPESEAEIQQALSTLVKGRTVLVIAHRPAAIRGAHRIVVMERGRIRAVGSHEELLDEPHYRALLHQSGELRTASAEEDHR